MSIINYISGNALLKVDTTIENQHTVFLSIDFSNQLGVIYQLNSTNAQITPPPISPSNHIYTSTEAVLYPNDINITPRFAETIIRNGSMQMQLFETATSTGIISVIASTVPFSWGSIPMPESIVIPRTNLI